jgi:formamidopyrimidine-DNA glycosylase
MPELPEVETVRRGLEPRLAGRTVTAADIRDGRLTAPVDPLEVALELGGERFSRVGRRGKYLLLGFDSGRTLVVHLRMTGWFHHRPAAATDPEPAHLRAVFALDDGASLLYVDQRRFGTMRLIEPGGLEAHLRLRAGPEPLSEDWSPRRLRTDLAGRRAPVKALLLHQGIVAGVGNIYADEALWHARIHPLRPGGSLSAAEVRRLHAAVVQALERGIDSRGASLRDYRDVNGDRGSMQERFAAYARTGEPCPRCGTPILKIRVAQRGTHLCPRCTRQPSA